MSYILDALRKSEAERARGEAPSLLTTTDSHRFVPRYVIWLLIAILGVNALLLVVWLMPAPVPDLQEAQSPPPTVAPAPSRAEPAASANPDVAATPSVASTPTRPAPAAQEYLAPADRPVAATVPQIDISTHVYSEDPELRAVTVAGRRFGEGDEILPGVRLVEITETGVIVESGGLHTEIDVLQDWR